MDITTNRVISIYGPAGSGKSQLAKAVEGRLGADRCARVPTDYFLVPADGPLPAYFARPATYDWELLRRVLALPEGTETSTPDFDFELFRRRAEIGGRPLVVRRVMVTDAMEPYPNSDGRVLLVAPATIRRERIGVRDKGWNTRVLARWEHLEATWAHVTSIAPACDLELDGSRPIEENAARLAAWLVRRFGAESRVGESKADDSGQAFLRR